MNLATLKWSDLRYRNYTAMQVIDNNVLDLSMSKDGVGLLFIHDKLKLPSGMSFDLKEVNDKAEWTNLDRVAKHWIATGNVNDTAIFASVGLRGYLKSSLNIRLTSNSYETKKPPHIYCIRTAFERRGKAVILAIERDGICHLIGMTSRGKLSIIERLSNITDGQNYPHPNYKVILSEVQSGREGEFILGGYCWIKKLTLKLK